MGAEQRGPELPGQQSPLESVPAFSTSSVACCSEEARRRPPGMSQTYPPIYARRRPCRSRAIRSSHNSGSFQDVHEIPLPTRPAGQQAGRPAATRYLPRSLPPMRCGPHPPNTIWHVPSRTTGPAWGLRRNDRPTGHQPSRSCGARKRSKSRCTQPCQLAPITRRRAVASLRNDPADVCNDRGAPCGGVR